MKDERPLTVLHVFSGDLWAGAEVMVLHLLTSLAGRAGVQVIALSLNEGELTGRLRRAGIETHCLVESGRSFGAIALAAVRLLRGRRVDVIHSHRYKENLLAWLLGVRLGVRGRVATLHGFPEPRESLRGREALTSRRDRTVLRHGFTRVVTVSQEMRHTLVSAWGFPPGRVEAIWNGVAVPPGTTRRGRDGRLHVGTVARLVPVKGFDLLLDVAARLAESFENIRFSVLGDGPLRPWLTAEVTRRGLGSRMTLFPAQSDPFPHYRTLDLYLNTSLHEGMPLSVLEAMGCGVPVVATRVGGIPEAVGHGEHGFLIEGRDPAAYTAWCRALLSDEHRRREMGQKAIERVRTIFGVGPMAAAYNQLYRHCAG